MNVEVASRPEVRRASKVMLRIDDSDKILFVAGKRGMFNLPGGGIDLIESEGGLYEEDSLDALYRELGEELGLSKDDVAGVAEVCGTWHTVTPEDGLAKRAVWSVFSGELQTPAAELVIPAGSEITAIQAFTPEECLRHPNMSQLAKYAIGHVLSQNN